MPTSFTRIAFLVLVIAGLAALSLRAPSSEGLNGQGPGGIPETTCYGYDQDNFYLSKPPPASQGQYFVGSDIKIEAVSQVTRAVVVGGNMCIAKAIDVPTTEWELVQKPGSGSTITTLTNFRAQVHMAEAGTYTVQFTACPNGCLVIVEGLVAPVSVPAITVEDTFMATDVLPFPPQTQPVLPSFSDYCNAPSTQAFCAPTDFNPDDLDTNCAGGGGVVDPQWVTVAQWDGPEDYVTAEGRVMQSRVSRKDWALNHDSQDHNLAVELDLPNRYLVSTVPESSFHPYELGIEWERDSYPEFYWPTIGDRISAFGYWIHDCGHDGFYTEVHPAVGIATHRARAVPLPASEGLGNDIWLPGVVSDVYFNREAGEITNNCSKTGLHQPGAGNHDLELASYCIPQPDTGGRNPINRVWEYNIYLPPNPENILMQAGHADPPDVELYLSTSGNPLPNVQQVQAANSVTYLHVTLDLTNYSGETYSGNVTAAWTYPAPDNWGLKEYKFRLNKLVVEDDADYTFCTPFSCYSGDWRLWINVKSVDREWTKLYDCEDCIDDDTDYNFGGRPWETSASDSDRYLGANVLLYPEQFFTLFVTGFEDDGIETGDNLGTVGYMVKQPTQTITGRSHNICTEDSSLAVPIVDINIVGSECGQYLVDFQIILLAEVPAQLSAAGQQLYDSSLVHAGDIGMCIQHQIAATCFDEIAPVTGEGWHPNAHHFDDAVSFEDLSAFEPQEEEENALTDIGILDLKTLMESMPEPVLDDLLDDLRGLLDMRYNDRPAWDIELLQLAIPPDKWQEHFADFEFQKPLWGDLDCNQMIGEGDILASLKTAGRLPHSAPCLNVGDVNCDEEYDAHDTLALLFHYTGNNPTAQPAGASCRDIGDEVTLELLEGGPTPTPTATAPPPGTSTPTATATVTPTATPTPSPSPTPSPTPDVTAPSITNVTANPDGNSPNFVYDHTGSPGFCTTTLTTLSATVTDTSGLANVKLFVRYHDGANPPTGYTDVGPTFNGGTQKYEKVIDYPLDATTAGGAIQYFWQAQDTNGNISIFPTVGFNSVPIADCDSVIG